MASRFNDYCGNSTVSTPDAVLRLDLFRPKAGLPGAHLPDRGYRFIPGCRQVRLPALRTCRKDRWMN